MKSLVPRILCAMLVLAATLALHAAQFGDFTYEASGTEITITGYTGSGNDVTIPDTIAGLPVTRVGVEAFGERTNLTSVTIPDSVTTIGDAAFYGCSGLTSVYFEGNAPQEVGGGAFSGSSAIVYRQPGTTGWRPTFQGHPVIEGRGACVLEVALHPVIQVTGEVGATYVIESAPAVEGDLWLTRGWIELTTPTVNWTDPVPADSPRKIYRAVRVTKPTVETIPNMVWIPPGRFVMGSPETERERSDFEGPQTRVELTQGFWMGKYEVTQREYLAVMGNNPSFFKPPSYSEDLDRPVEEVSWDDAVAYCQALIEQERGAGRLPEGWKYRLPTEAEWEYACRAGTTTRFSFGDALECDDGCEYCPLLDSNMWWCGNSGGVTHAVGQRLPNAWGLNDMHGNVLEWCQDLFDWEDPQYPGGAVMDPQGSPTGSFRVIRGGGNWSVWYLWDALAGYCRSAYRYGGYPVDRLGYLGFRAVLAPGQ